MKAHTDGLGPGLQDSQCLRMQVAVNREGVPATHPVGQCHRLGRRGRLVQQGGVGHRKTGEVGHQRLECEQALETAL